MNNLQVFNYNGAIIQRRPDGFINLTQMCQANGKRLDKWRKANATNAYIEALQANYPQMGVVETVEGLNGGTWGHPSLAINLARWISPEFAVWCDAHIFNLMTTGQTSLDIDPVEEMKLRIRLAELEGQKAQTELATLNLRNTIVLTCPEPVQQKILGYQVVKEIEIVEKHVTPEGTYDGVGITYIQKRYGFKTTKQAWDFLERIGYGRESGKWETSLAAVERLQLPREFISDLDDRFPSAQRQRFLGEE